MNEPDRRLSSEPALLQLRVIAFAMLASAVMIAGVGFALTLGKRPAASGGAATALFALWVATAIATTAGWWVLSRDAGNQTRGPGARAAVAAGRAGPERMVTRLIAAYALLEAQLLVAFVASFLHGTPMLLVPALSIVALGILLRFPRGEWFARLDRGR